VFNVVSGYGKNLKMALRLGDKLSPAETHYWLGFNELHVQRMFVKVIKKGFITYDIGAYIGFYSLLTGRLSGPCGKVYAFEPLPNNIERLKLHILLNNMQDRIFCIPKAVTDKTGRAICHYLGYDDMSRFVNIDYSEEGHLTKESLVAETISLDEFVFHQGYPAANLIKIDVEGAELKVLLGARRLLEEFKPVIICELHSTELAVQVYEELARLGYRLEDLKRRAKSFIPNRCHIVAWPKE
jgi:FkbM family methyltransferase